MKEECVVMGGTEKKSSERKIFVFPSKAWDKKGKRKNFT